MSKSTLPLLLRGASENNLKNISLDIDHDELTVVTGLSGSGKSSLAFSTVYAEGQRRYIETFSPYTRQFFDKIKKPDVENIENVRPAIAIRQRTRVTGSRSFVGSMTNINDLLKILYTNLAKPYSPISGKELIKWSPKSLSEDLKKRVKKDLNGKTFLITAPYSFNEKAKIKKGELERLQILGYRRYLDLKTDKICRFEESTANSIPNNIAIIFDRVRAQGFKENSVLDSIKQAFQLSRGVACLFIEDNNSFIREDYSTQYTSPDKNEPPLTFQVPPPRPALFDANSPIGACDECNGFGMVLTIDSEKVVPDKTLSIEEGAISAWNGDLAWAQYNKFLTFCEEKKIPTDRPWNKLTTAQKDLIFDTDTRAYKGVYAWFKKIESKAYKMHVRVFLARYRTQQLCPVCNGGRLKEESQIYKLGGVNLAQLWQMQINETLTWLETVENNQSDVLKKSKDIAEILHQLSTRLHYLSDLGLSYLTLGRQSRTLSGGETQRVNLATALGSGLMSTHFVLDEPSVGLHPRDTERLMNSVKNLRDAGNSVLVVEHDLDCIKEADSIVEIGPKAGALGGEVVFHGTNAKWKGIQPLPFKSRKRNPEKLPKIEIKNASVRNLKGFDCSLPIGAFSAVTGVSGSGKSTLIHEVLLKYHKKNEAGEKLSKKENVVQGLSTFAEVLLVDQSGLAKSPRANIATYSGIWDIIRAQLAAKDDAAMRSLTKSSFSFNVDGGRCPPCKGTGYIREDMQFLSEVYVLCDTCLGKRFQQKVLEVEFLERNADQWLKSTVDECSMLLQNYAKARNACETLSALGLGHLRIGHPLSELSGGEAQRLKLVPFLGKAAEDPALLLFDEPTTGLHLHDVHRLLLVISDLIDRGHTVVCVEHNQELIRHAEWIVDLGPEGGSLGGELLYCGAVGKFLTTKNRKSSETAKYLSSYNDSLKATGKKAETKKKKSRKGMPLSVHRAREHNLKDISIEIPHDKVIALTGVSGSGKSTLAKDIIYAEGQRRYLDCLSPYARQFIRELSRPDVELVENIRPTICVYQHTFQPGKLSTVGTLSEVYNFLRLLYAKLGIQHCPDHPDMPVSALSATEIAKRLKVYGKTEVKLLAPIIKGRKGLHKSVFQRAVTSEIGEVRVDGQFGSPSFYLPKGLEKNKTHTIEYIWAKVIPARVPEELLVNAVEEVFALGGGTLIVHTDKGEEVFSRDLACPSCGRGFFKPDPEDLSFHSKRGRCESCSGTGKNARGDSCKKCDGIGLKAIGRNIRVDGLTLPELTGLSASEVLARLRTTEFEPHKAPLAEPILKEIFVRLETLLELSLDYLPLNRSCAHLSGGELQRLRLSAALGTPLSGAIYIFDEPSAGLHPSDNREVLSQFQKIRDGGNTVILIEHDEETILSADHIIEVGPGGGAKGGEITFNDSIAKYGGVETEKISFEKRPKAEDFLTIKNATKNNIEELNLKMPLQRMSVIAGVSGAGKSTLVNGIIKDSFESKALPAKSFTTEYAKIYSSIAVDRVLVVDQSPIGKNARSTPASYLKVWDEIRKLYALTPLARAQGWTAGFFSYNSGKGRCPECKGLGRIKLEMSFLSEAYVGCDYCGGRRYGDEALSVKYLDRSVDEVLAMTFEEAKLLFKNHAKVHRILHNACELGLGYLTLGQSSSTLSGGESQRIKLVTELARPPKGHSIYILDEPTIGLHRKDVCKLLKVLHGLVANGNTVIMIEHDKDALLAGDEVIELGPGAGDEGGKIIYQGKPSGLSKKKTPWAELLKSDYRAVA